CEVRMTSPLVSTRKDYAALQPPSIEMAAPVVSTPSGPHRKATSPAMRSGETNLPDGWREPMNAFSASARGRFDVAMKSAKRCSIDGVGEEPGQTALQVMFCAAVSNATARVKPIIAVLVVT